MYRMRAIAGMHGKEIWAGNPPQAKPLHAGRPSAPAVATRHPSALNERAGCTEARYGPLLLAEGYAVYIDFS